MADPNLLIMVGAVFCLAGFVKGMVGLGLPTVSLGLLSIIVDLPTAMALLVMPSLATNFWQALAGGKIGALWRRLWRFFAGTCRRTYYSAHPNRPRRAHIADRRLRSQHPWPRDDPRSIWWGGSSWRKSGGRWAASRRWRKWLFSTVMSLYCVLLRQERVGSKRAEL